MNPLDQAVVDREEQGPDELVVTTAPVEEKKIVQIHSPVEKVIAALKKIEQLQGLSDAEFEWLAKNGTELFAPEGTIIFREGAPANRMTIILDGEIHVQAKNQLFIGRSGQITGVLPFSRMKAYGGKSTAVADTWALEFNREMFPDILRQVPTFSSRAVATLLDRVREVTRMEQQTEKLLALGKLAGNLSHELNNPASAAQRSATNLLEELRVYGRAKFELGRLCLDDAAYQSLRDWAQNVREQLRKRTAASPIALSDREEHLTTWLVSHNVPEPWTIVPALAEANVEPRDLDLLTAFLPATALSTVLLQSASSLRAERMTEAVLDATDRIFELIRAIKDYSYMDQAPLQEVDLAQSLDNTLAMLSSQMSGINIEREYEPGLPRIMVYGSELNQVWMALIENAVEAMRGHGTLRLATARKADAIMVEIWDDGPGVPPELQDRIFEPFFTTKAPGRGLGLGLDTAMRIMRKHRGQLTVQSKPGATCFQVRLPLHLAGAY
jgi:signal transduction histidine kinase